MREDGGRVTAAKDAMLAVFYDHPGGMTADEVADRVSGVDESTVYRGLAQLESLGIIEHVHRGHGPATYHLAGRDAVSIVCEDCGRVVELPRHELIDLVARVAREHGMVVDLRHFALTGRCETCAAAADAIGAPPRSR